MPRAFPMTNFLVAQSNRQTYLAFVNQGMHSGWDDALRRMSAATRALMNSSRPWLKNLRDTKRQAQGTMVASDRRQWLHPIPTLAHHGTADGAARCSPCSYRNPNRRYAVRRRTTWTIASPIAPCRSRGRNICREVRTPSVSSSPSGATWPQASTAPAPGLPASR